MKNMTVERSAKLYRKEMSKPWTVSQLRGAQGEKYVSITTPYDETQTVILREWADSNYKNMLAIMKEAVEPDNVKLWWGDLS